MNLKNELLNVNKYFSPKIVGEVNEQYIKVAKIKGQEVPWHNHENEDELFYIIEGSLCLLHNYKYTQKDFEKSVLFCKFRNARKEEFYPRIVFNG
jgi:hypothetical protein